MGVGVRLDKQNLSKAGIYCDASGVIGMRFTNDGSSCTLCKVPLDKQNLSKARPYGDSSDAIGMPGRPLTMGVGSKLK